MDLPRFQRSLLRWFSKTRRPLPWRATADPYAIWVSEMMLQQTTVATVIPYYRRFLAKFPTVQSLARSNEAAVLSAWSGLGYYSRARNLLRAAVEVVRDHGGVFPRDPATAITLPGIGPYAANAITSIAYDMPAAVVDGNVQRVLSRLHRINHPPARAAQTLASRLLSRTSPGTWNEAMMELGATICTPRTPDCGRCPVAEHCRGKDRPEHWSRAKPRRTTIPTVVHMALILNRRRVLLHRNPKGAFMSGFHELPNSGIPGTIEIPTEWPARYRRIFAVDHQPVAVIRHAVTHHRIQATVFKGTLKSATRHPHLSFHTLRGCDALPLGGLTRKALRRLARSGQAGWPARSRPLTKSTRRLS